MAMPYAPAPALALALLVAFGLAVTPVVQSDPTVEAIKATCAKAMQPDPCLEVLLANLEVRTPAVNGVPEMSLQVAAKVARDADEFAKAKTGTNPPPSKCLVNCADDIDKVAKKLEALPLATIKAGDETGVLSFIEGFKRTCGDDCPAAATETSKDERAAQEKFNGVMKALGVMQDLFMTKT